MNHLALVRAAVVASLIPAVALAAIGTVSVVEKPAFRTPAGSGTKIPLEVGSEIELKDTLDVGAKGNLKVTLTDGSVLMLGSKSRLVIDEASYRDQEREGFSASLTFGKVWAKVTKAFSGSDAKFNVKTERAVAGVRGTIFRVDTGRLVKTAAITRTPTTIVRVTEGRVAVEAQVRRTAQAQAPVQPAKGPRRQVAGPQQISKEEWERKFVELQANQQVAVGEELWQEAAYDAAAKSDAFAKFVEKHQ